MFLIHILCLKLKVNFPSLLSASDGEQSNWRNFRHQQSPLMYWLTSMECTFNVLNAQQDARWSRTWKIMYTPRLLLQKILSKELIFLCSSQVERAVIRGSYLWLKLERLPRSFQEMRWLRRCSWSTDGCWWAPGHCVPRASPHPWWAPPHQPSIWHRAWGHLPPHRWGWHCPLA